MEDTKSESAGLSPVFETKSLLRRVKDRLKPGSDLRVTTTTGATYSGVLVIEDNVVCAGIVARSADGTD